MTADQIESQTAFPLGALVATSRGLFRGRVIAAVDQAAAGVTEIRLGSVLIHHDAEQYSRVFDAGAVRLTAAERDALIDALVRQRTTTGVTT